MRRGVWEGALWLATALACAWGYGRWTRAAAPPPAGVPPRIAALPEAPARARGAAPASIARTVGANPFRLDRGAAAIPYASASLPDAPAPAPPPPPPAPIRPNLVVSGIVGPPWAAVLEGVPGRPQGVVVRAGDQLGELRVRAVSPGAVVVVGPDTTWRLTLRKTWQ